MSDAILYGTSCCVLLENRTGGSSRYLPRRNALSQGYLRFVMDSPYRPREPRRVPCQARIRHKIFRANASYRAFMLITARGCGYCSSLDAAASTSSRSRSSVASKTFDVAHLLDFLRTTDLCAHPTTEPG